jgi:UV DNA damage endonuclease
MGGVVAFSLCVLPASVLCLSRGERQMRLGFAVKVLGQPGLKSNDTRRWQNSPHLSVSLAYLRDIFVYLSQIGVQMYRMSSDLAPYVTHPDMPQFHNQIEESERELAAIGDLAREHALRLSFHPAAYVVLNSPDQAVAAKSAADLEAQARILDLMGLGPEAVVVTHVGGRYGDKAAATERFVMNYLCLSEAARRRTVLENDDRAYTVTDTYRIHQQTGIRLVLDQLHHLCNPAPQVTLAQALDLALSTWPADQIPKIHFSSPRTAMVVTEREDRSDPLAGMLRQPRLSHHADLIDPFSLIGFLRSALPDRDFDVMLECKAKDLALLRLRRHLDQLTPDLVARYHII